MQYNSGYNIYIEIDETSETGVRIYDGHTRKELKQYLRKSNTGRRYYAVMIHGKPTYVHRLVCYTYHSNDYLKMRRGGLSSNNIIAHHINNNPYDNRPDNLTWLDRKQHAAVHNLKGGH